MTTQLDPYVDAPPGPGGPSRAVIAIVVVVVIAALAGGLFLAARFLADLTGGESDPEIVAGVPVAIVVPEGASARTVGRILEQAQVVASGSAFEREVSNRSVANRIRAGDYDLVTAMDLDALIEELTTGPPAAPSFTLRVIEGLRIEEMLDSIASQAGGTRADYEEALLSGAVTSPYLPEVMPPSATPLQAWEGLLAPDTYEIVSGSSPAAILQEMASTLTTRVNAQDWSTWEALGLDGYDGLVIASLIEKEAKLDEDRPLIASVIFNRLERGIALQIDATVIYALGENPGRVLLSDLEIESPWNTYKYPGLPPTPIGGVRRASLQAAAAPAVTDFLYYVLVDPSGAHGFTASYDEFLRFKAKAKADGVIP